MRVARQGGPGYIYVAAVGDDLIQPTMACQRRSADPRWYPERARCNGQADEEQGAGLVSIGRIVFASPFDFAFYSLSSVTGIV